METNDHLSEIFEALNKAKVEFIVAGGVAVVLHGVERATMDLDLSLRMEAENIRRFLSVMSHFGMVPRVPVSPEALLDAGQRERMVLEKQALVFTFIHPDKPFQQVDVFLSPLLDYEKLKPDSETIKIGGTSARLLSKKQLIDLKRIIQPPRDKDLFDIAALEKLLTEK